jgi:hypothetical protein
MTPLEQAERVWHGQLLLDPAHRKSQRQIAKDLDISHVTLSNHLAGRHKPQQESHVHLQALTPAEEDTIIEYLRRMTNAGHPIPARDIMSLANKLREHRLSLNPSASQTEYSPLSHTWLPRFKKRHPEVKSMWTKSVERARIEEATTAKLRPWFDDFELMMQKHYFPLEHIYNMDESGYAMGATQSTAVVVVVERGSRWAKKARKIKNPRGEWVTTVECISAAGKVIPPLVIFKAQGAFQLSWVPEKDPLVKDYTFCRSPSGWTNNYTSYKWLKDVFEPNTCPTDPDQWRLLIVNGHGSHMKARFVAYCMAHKVELMVLPSHTSHLTQPLDVGIFGPLKAAMGCEVDKAIRYGIARVQKAEWVVDLAQARENAMVEKNILVGWKQAGLIPYAPWRVLNQATDPIPPPPTASERARAPLATITHDNRQFLNVYGEDMSPVVKRKFTQLADTVEASNARNTMLEKENTDLKAIQAAKKKTRGGVTVTNLKTHILTVPMIRRQLEEHEAKNKGKKGKGRGTVTFEESSGGEEEEEDAAGPS